MCILLCEKEVTFEILEVIIIKRSGRRHYSLVSSSGKGLQHVCSLQALPIYMKVAYSFTGVYQYFLWVNAGQWRMDFKQGAEFFYLSWFDMLWEVKCCWTWSIHAPDTTMHVELHWLLNIKSVLKGLKQASNLPYWLKNHNAI